MRIYKLKAFARFARKERITGKALRQAVTEAQANPTADLGGGVIKQRVARPGEGKSGGYRTLIALRSERRAVFLHGFAKKDADNVTPKHLALLKKLAAYYLESTDEQVEGLVDGGELTEVTDDEEDESDEGGS